MIPTSCCTATTGGTMPSGVAGGRSNRWRAIAAVGVCLQALGCVARDTVESPLIWSSACEAAFQGELTFRTAPFRSETDTTATSAGCVANGASVTYYFPVPRSGEIAASVSSARPNQDLIVSIGQRQTPYGQYPYDCSLADTEPWRLAVGTNSASAVVTAGDYCVKVGMTRSDAEVFYQTTFKRP